MITGMPKLGSDHSGLMVISLGVVNGIVLKSFVGAGVSSNVLLAERGLGCALLVVLFALISRQSPWPRNPSLQAARFVIAGLSLTMAMTSYSFINASTALLLARTDIPLLAILTSGRRAWATKMLGAACIAWYVSIALYFRNDNESALGYWLALGAGTAVAFGYLLVHKTANSEKRLVTMLTPALASMLFGSVGYAFAGDSMNATVSLSVVPMITGVFMFGLYWLAYARHRRMRPSRAELPAVLVPLAAIPLEHLIMGTKFNASYAAALVLGSALCLTLILRQSNIEGGQNA